MSFDIEKFKKNVIDSYIAIHGDIKDLEGNIQKIKGDENFMSFHGTQRPYEFFKAWEFIYNYKTEKKEISFLEIGAAKGLWSIAFIEFCKMIDKEAVYVTVSLQNGSHLNNCDIEWNSTLLNVKNYYGNEFKEWVLFDDNSQTESTKNKVLSIRESYDFILIDGDHSYNGVLNDTNLYSPLAEKLLIYHDISPYNYGDTVLRAINDCSIKIHHEIFCENSGQGIGINIKI